MEAKTYCGKEKTSNLELKLRQSGETVKYLEFDLLLSRKQIEKLEEDLTVERDPGLSTTHGSSRTFPHDETASSSEEAEPLCPSHPRRDLSLTLREDILQDEEIFLGLGRPADLSPHSSRHSFEGLEAALEQEAGVAEAQILPTRSTEDYIHIENVETTSIRPPKKSKASITLGSGKTQERSSSLS